MYDSYDAYISRKQTKQLQVRSLLYLYSQKHLSSLLQSLSKLRRVSQAPEPVAKTGGVLFHGEGSLSLKHLGNKATSTELFWGWATCSSIHPPAAPALCSSPLQGRCWVSWVKTVCGRLFVCVLLLVLFVCFPFCRFILILLYKIHCVPTHLSVSAVVFCGVPNVPFTMVSKHF